MAQAEDIMLRENSNALIGQEGDALVMIEDVADPDGRLYRMEYQSTPDGRHAIAYCRYNPWGTPNGGEPATVGHCFDNGLLCIGSGHAASPQQSHYDLNSIIQRARYWCTGFSVLKETGTFPQP